MEKNTITIKLDLDMEEATKKLEQFKKQLQEVLELQNKLEIKEEKQKLPANINVKFGDTEVIEDFTSDKELDTTHMDCESKSYTILRLQ